MQILEYGKEIEELITDNNSLKVILDKMREFYDFHIKLSNPEIDEIEI
jgi:hypothetical protein